MKELKVRQEKFCQAYVLYRNATESAKIAGYSEGSAHTQGHRLLQREDIKQRIEELEKEVETRIDVSTPMPRIMDIQTAPLRHWKFCLAFVQLKRMKHLSQ
jgi:phage terminase small subunit